MKMMLPAIVAILSALPQAQAMQIQIAIQPGTQIDPPPIAVSDLLATDSTETTVALQWTAPSDSSPSQLDTTDDLIGGGSISPAVAYDLRYSLVDPATVGSSWWTDATPSGDDDGMQPASPGKNELLTVTGLLPGQTYYFAIKSRDGVSIDHWSALSNIAMGVTTAIPVAPPEPEPVDDGTQPKSGGGCGGSAAGRAAGTLLAAGLALVLRRR